jgi:hypothetical protein
LATAVDLRRIDREKLAGRFGLYVGHWINMLDEPEAMDLEGTLQEMTRQTQLEKSTERYLGLEWHWRALLFLRRWLSVNENRNWHRKVYPLSAGVSHVRLDGSGFGAAKHNVLRYFLVPPPGPALPLVLAPVSLNENLTFAAVYREAALNASQVAKLMALFFAGLENFAREESSLNASAFSSGNCMWSAPNHGIVETEPASVKESLLTSVHELARPGARATGSRAHGRR